MEKRLQDQPEVQGIFDGLNLIVDGTECRIQRPSMDSVQRLFYSGKKKCHTIKYEVAVNKANGHFCWVNGPFPGSVHDITMLRLGGLLNAIPEGTYSVLRFADY